jgi:hypothetical protein
MFRKRRAMRPSVTQLEDRIVLNGHVSAAQIPGGLINTQLIAFQIATAFDATYLEVVQRELAALTPGGPPSSLRTEITQALNNLSREVTAAVSQVPGTSTVIPILQNEITGNVPGSMQQILGTIPNNIPETGDVGAVKENLYIQITTNTFASAKLASFFRVVILSNAAKQGIRGSVNNLGAIQTSIASDYDAALAQVVEAEVVALTPGAPPPATPLSATIASTVGQLSTQVAQDLATVPGASSTLIPLVQAQIADALIGSLFQVLSTVPNSIHNTGGAGAVQQNLYIQLSVDAFLFAKLAALDTLNAYSIVIRLI